MYYNVFLVIGIYIYVPLLDRLKLTELYEEIRPTHLY